MHNDALCNGILPEQFWNMSPKEVKDTVYSRIKQRQNDIYSLSGMIRVAVLSCFKEDVQFPDSPYADNKVGEWQNSKKYMEALSKIHKGGAKN